MLAQLDQLGCPWEGAEINSTMEDGTKICLANSRITSNVR